LFFKLNHSDWGHRSFLTFKLWWYPLYLWEDNLETYLNNSELSFTWAHNQHWEIFKSKHLLSFKKWYSAVSGWNDDSPWWTSLFIKHKVSNWIALCQRKYNFKLPTCHGCQESYNISKDAWEQLSVQRKSTKGIYTWI